MKRVAAPVVAMNAYLHFAVLYKTSPVGLSQPTILKSPPAELRGVWKEEWKDEKLNRKLQEIAWEIVSRYEPSGVPAALRAAK